MYKNIDRLKSPDTCRLTFSISGPRLLTGCGALVAKPAIVGNVPSWPNSRSVKM